MSGPPRLPLILHPAWLAGLTTPVAPEKKPPVWIHDGTRLYRSDWPAEPVNRPPIENNSLELPYLRWLVEDLEEARREREARGEPAWTYAATPLEPVPQAVSDEVLQRALNIRADKERALATAAEAATTAKWLAENGLELAWDPANNVVILATGATITGKEADRRIAALSLGVKVGVLVVGAAGVAVTQVASPAVKGAQARKLLRDSLGTDPFNGLGRAHHVFPVTIHDSAVGQRLRKWGIDLNSAATGIWPPSQKAPGWNGAIHRGGNTDAYVWYVERQLDKATNRAEALQLLEKLKQALRDGKLKLNAAE